MRLWIMRHAYAGDFLADPKKERDRPLKPEGAQMAQAIADAMWAKGERPCVLFCSPFVRAMQTGDIVAKTHGIASDVVDDISPNRPLEERVLELMGHSEMKKIMLVGHHDNTTPMMQNFGGDDDWDPLVMAEVRRVKIDRDSGKWKLRWQLRPSDLGLRDYGAA